MKRPFPLSTRQSGVGLVTAIFLLVVLAGLSVAMVSLFTSQQASADLDLQGARAYQAARAGIEWGLYQRMRNGSCNYSDSSVDMSNGGSLSGFRVFVSCTQPSTNAMAPTTIVSVACNILDGVGKCGPVPNPESVRRTLEVQL
jgi:MSHA biogenesis protein MshP